MRIDFPYHLLNTNVTYLFELITPWNRIVVEYGYDDLVLLGVIITKTGEEIPYEKIKQLYDNIFTIVKRYDILKGSFKKLQELELENKEGFVIRFSNGFRVKVKFAEYVRLHGILTNVSNLTVWRHLKNGESFDELLDKVPDEFYEWLTNTESNLRRRFMEIEKNAFLDFYHIYFSKGLINRKDFAEEALKVSYSGLLFSLYELFDNRDYDEVIWKRLRPEFSKPFKDGYEDI